MLWLCLRSSDGIVNTLEDQDAHASALAIAHGAAWLFFGQGTLGFPL